MGLDLPGGSSRLPFFSPAYPKKGRTLSPGPPRPSPSCPLEVFPNIKKIPLITRRSGLDKSQARLRFGLPADATVALLTFGGFGLERLPLEKLERLGEIFFVD